jgi:hypothetical protein
MTSVSASAAIGLTVAIGPVIAAHLVLQIWVLDQLGPIILGLIIGMQAASRRRTHRCRPDEAVADARRLLVTGNRE